MKPSGGISAACLERMERAVLDAAEYEIPGGIAVQADVGNALRAARIVISIWRDNYDGRLMIVCKPTDTVAEITRKTIAGCQKWESLNYKRSMFYGVSSDIAMVQ